MTKVEFLNKNMTLGEIEELMRTERLVVLPFSVNRDVYIVQNHHPQQVMMTDCSVNGIQLNGSWVDWASLDKGGGIYGSEFEALSAIAERGL